MSNSKNLTAMLVALSLLGGTTLIASAQETAPAAANETPVAAPADAPEDNGGMWQKMKAKFGRDKKGGHHRALFMEVDADKNGSVTIEEINTYRTAKVASADTSKDGALSLDEFTTAYTAMIKDRTAKAFEKLDENSDGSITSTEIDSTVSEMFAKMDTNGDGAINKDDRPKKGGKRHGKGRHDGAGPEDGENN